MDKIKVDFEQLASAAVEAREKGYAMSVRISPMRNVAGTGPSIPEARGEVIYRNPKGIAYTFLLPERDMTDFILSYIYKKNETMEAIKDVLEHLVNLDINVWTRTEGMVDKEFLIANGDIEWVNQLDKSMIVNIAKAFSEAEK